MKYVKEQEAHLRKLIKTSAGWIHTSLILAIIIPLIYALFIKEQIPYLYLKCLLILFPVVITDFAADRCRNLLSYLIWSALTFAMTGAAAWVLTGSLRDNVLFWGYILFLLGETLFIIVNRLTARIRKKKDAEAATIADPTFHPFYDILKEPAFPVLFYFGAAYILAVNFNSPSVCNAALFSAIVYVLITFLYQYVNETEHYLSLNKRTCNLPSKRIYAIGSGILAIYLLILITLTLPSIFTISHRHYRDLKETADDMEIGYVELIPEYNSETTAEDPLTALMLEYDNVTFLPWWIDYIFYIIAVFFSIFLTIALIKKVYAVFQDFRISIDENGDIVEELQDTAENIRKIKIPAIRRSRKLSEKERIRKEYRKTIRLHRKDRPAIYESPAEIEDKAGIAGTKETLVLHRRYELARYGQE